MRLRKITSLLILGIVSLTGCAGETNQPEQTKEIEKQDEQKQENVEVKKEEKQVKEQEKEEVLRIVASTVASTQVLDKLEVELVGIPSTKYTLPTRYEGVTTIGQPMSPDYEIIASLNPDLIVFDAMFKEDVEGSLESYNMEGFYFNTSSYKSFLESTEALAELIGKEDEAAVFIESLKEVEQGIQQKGKEEAPTVAILFGAGENFMLATGDSYIGDLVKTIGGVNITDELNVESAYIPFSMEQIVAADPDYILRFSHANIEETKKAFDKMFDKNPAFDTLTAVKENRVVDLENGVFGVSANIYVAEALQTLGNIFYGE